MKWEFLIVPLSSFLTAVLTTPAVIRLANVVGAIDHPNYRKIHSGAMPRLGGLAIFVSLVVGVSICTYYANVSVKPLIMATFLGAVLVLVTGIIDDIRGLGAWGKLVVEIVAALLPVLYGLRIDFLSNPFGEMWITAIGLISIPLTVIWIVGVTNAVNLSDGLDGLASGLVTISALILALYSYMNGVIDIALVSVAIAGATLGFLAYNFHPAKIFLGDSGALMLGYLLAVLSIMGVAKGATLLTLLVPVFIMGVPVLDTVSAVIRRLISGNPIFHADRGHIHHKLLDAGMSHRDTVFTVYLLAIISGAIGLVLGRVPIAYYGLTLLVVFVFFIGILTARTRLANWFVIRRGTQEVAASKERPVE